MESKIEKVQLAQDSGENFTKAGFIISAIGSAVGLGNMWKFPYVTGQNGGGAFFLLFLVFLLIIGLPILLAELSLGRAGKGDVVTSFKNLSSKGGKYWGIFGYIFILGTLMILAYYSVVTGWTIFYAVDSFSGSLYQSTDFLQHFHQFSGGYQPLIYHLIAVILTGSVLLKGVSSGIEKLNKVLIPSLVIILVLLMIQALNLPGAAAGVEFFLKPDFSKLTVTSALVALGQAFFSLSLGMGSMITYGSYVSRNQSLGQATCAVGVGNILYALLAGLIVFPTMFTFGMSNTQGPELVFAALPAAFKSMSHGGLFGGLFFVLLAAAAVTSYIALLEVPVAFFMGRFGMGRKKAVSILCALVLLLGLPTSLSVHGPLADMKVFGLNIFDLFEYISSNIILPVGGLAVTLFIGYVSKKGAEEAGLNRGGHKIWLFLLRFVIPVFMIIIFLNSIGLLTFS